MPDDTTPELTPELPIFSLSAEALAIMKIVAKLGFIGCNWRHQGESEAQRRLIGGSAEEWLLWCMSAGEHDILGVLCSAATVLWRQSEPEQPQPPPPIRLVLPNDYSRN